MAPMIIRIQSSEGTVRVKTSSDETLSTFFKKIETELSLPKKGWTLYKNRNKTEKIESSTRKTLDYISLKHGDMLFIDKSKLLESEVPSNESSSSWTSTSISSSSSPSGASSNDVKEDDIDVFLFKEDGLIHRKKDPHMCHHGDHSKCIHCVPLEPYDETYLKEHDPPIKHMSFHAYLKRLCHGTDKGKFAVVEDISCKIKPGCTEHPPWPGGICTKCQPSAITLKRQEYRHVDNILFENPLIVEPFLDYWRKTGNQRIGILIGRYEHHKEVPLGIRAVVAAIYEPPQECTPDSVELLADPNNDTVQKVAADLGLQFVGWIFTDLVPDDVKKGTVKQLRGIDTHFLMAEECIMAGHFQNQYASPCRFASSGKFGSKFVTVVVSGHEGNQIGFDGYQVSNQCMALVRDDCLLPTIDEPGLGYIRESSTDQYVPDVFYKDKDSYNNEVTLLARPMPIEYVLVQVSAAFPVEPQYTFPRKGGVFPIENRENIGEFQNLDAITKHMAQYHPGEFLEAMTNFHLLVFLATCDILPTKNQITPLCLAIKNQDVGAMHDWKKSEHWRTVEEIVAAQGASSGLEAGSGDVDMRDISKTSAGSSWTCKHCTFINEYRDSCEMCGLPRS
ncbi:nuclear protein localization protein 4 homolog [Actinia tenebrosa]|uniref:Nuclear protein localization protein 4 homolog n=1 Tax=Actinia tenebrosa TaxID=6105 RepID=A0A6P8JG78_ACTTE|nr:nuclear protein localization protein 4 homolog [Actinia tenebrosa]